ncbi:hypothetical protein D3C73_500310 [compost metagenome]
MDSNNVTEVRNGYGSIFDSGFADCGSRDHCIKCVLELLPGYAVGVGMGSRCKNQYYYAGGNEIAPGYTEPDR